MKILLFSPLWAVQATMGSFGWLIPPAIGALTWFVLGQWGFSAEKRRRWALALLFTPIIYFVACMSLYWSGEREYRNWLDRVEKRTCDLRGGMTRAEVEQQIHDCTRLSRVAEDKYLAIPPEWSEMRTAINPFNWGRTCALELTFDGSGRLATYHTRCWD